MTASLHISIMQTRVGQNMGDHAQDIVRMHVADPSETIGELVERLLVEPQWVGVGHGLKPTPQYDNFLVIRVAEPCPETQLVPDAEDRAAL